MARRPPQDGELEGLTGIPLRIHCATTPDEVTELQVNAFLDTLADIAISVAKRQVPPQDGTA